MAAWQKESGTCTGRLFTGGGFLEKFKTWITKVPVSGGPGWFIVDDQSSSFLNPYIVISDKNFPYTNAAKHKILKVQLVTGVAQRMQVDAFHFWDTVTHGGIAAAWGTRYLRAPDTGSAYDFRGGPECLCITSRDGSQIDTCLLDEWIGPDDTYVLQPESATGTTTLATFIEAGDNNNQVGNYHLLTGYSGLLDANGKLYFKVTTSGANSQIDIYKDAALTLLIGHCGMSSTIGNVGVTEDNASGLGGLLQRTSIVANDLDISCDFSLTFGVGQGSNFTVGQFYFLYHYSATGVTTAYLKVISITGDKIIPSYTGNGVMPSGAIMSPYPHRFILWGNNSSGTSNTIICNIPYISTSAGEMINNNVAPFANTIYGITNPDDRLYYRASEITFYEQSGTGRRHYGVMKHLYLCSSTAMAVFIDGRTLDNGLNYFYILNTTFLISLDAWIIQDTTSLS